MAVVSGIDGSITFAGGYSLSCTAWTVNFTAEDVETTALGDKFSSHQGGLRKWAGTFNCLLTESLSGVTASNAVSLNLGGSAAAATFTAKSGATIAGDIMITGADITHAVESGAGEIVFTFVGSGSTGPTVS